MKKNSNHKNILWRVQKVAPYVLDVWTQPFTSNTDIWAQTKQLYAPKHIHWTLQTYKLLIYMNTKHVISTQRPPQFSWKIFVRLLHSKMLPLNREGFNFDIIREIAKFLGAILKIGKIGFSFDF